MSSLKSKMKKEGKEKEFRKKQNRVVMKKWMNLSLIKCMRSWKRIF